VQVTSKTEWLLRVPQIREDLAAIETPVVDRSMVEQLFRLKRRRSIELMHQLGGFQSGRTFLIDRLQLLQKLFVLAQAIANDFENFQAMAEGVGS
jgi:hypothetical protein